MRRSRGAPVVECVHKLDGSSLVPLWEMEGDGVGKGDGASTAFPRNACGANGQVSACYLESACIPCALCRDDRRVCRRATGWRVEAGNAVKQGLHQRRFCPWVVAVA